MVSSTFEKREASRELIDRHIAAGTCLACGEAVKDGDAIYTITGEHWDCVANRRALLSAGATQAKRGFARASGGNLIHIVDFGKGVSLCGHKPTNRRGMNRAKWIAWKAPSQGWPACRKCKAADALLDQEALRLRDEARQVGS